MGTIPGTRWKRIQQARMTRPGSAVSDEEAYLAQAADAADLELRLRQLERRRGEGALVRLKATSRARP